MRPRATQAPSPTHLTDNQAVAARLLWVALVAPMVAMFVLGLPRAYAILLSLNPEAALGLARLGLSPRIPALYMLALDVLTFGLCLACAVFILWRRPNDRMVFLVALVLVSISVDYTVATYESGAPIALIALFVGLGEAVQVTFLFSFPNGRFVPRWSWVVFPVLLMELWVSLALFSLPTYLDAPRTNETYGGMRQSVWHIAFFTALLVGGFASQVYRYRRISSPAQRQQTKWFLLGVLVALLVAVPYIVSAGVLGWLNQPGLTGLLVRLVGRTVRQMAFCLVPLSLLLSMLRYRLWDVDVLINRALVYSLLTGALGLAYFGSVTVLQQVLRTQMGLSSTVFSLVLSTLAIALLFEPVRQQVQRWIDRRFFRSKYDAERMLNQFGNAVQTEVDIDKLKQQLVSVVEQTLQPACVSVWVMGESRAEALPAHQMRTPSRKSEFAGGGAASPSPVPTGEGAPSAARGGGLANAQP